MAFDLAGLDQDLEQEERGIEVPVKNRAGVAGTYTDAAGHERPVVIVMAGKYSDRYKRTMARIDSRKVEHKTWAETKADQMRLTVACVIRWDGLTEHGQPYECTPFNATQLFRKYGWIYDDCVKAMEGEADFLMDSSPEQLNTSVSPPALVSVGTMDLVSETI